MPRRPGPPPHPGRPRRRGHAGRAGRDAANGEPAGVRGIEYSAARSTYLIAARPVADPVADGRGSFDLFDRTGRGKDDAVPVQGDADVLARLHDRDGRFAPEAMIVDPTGTRVLLLSDDGDHASLNGARCKDLPEAGARRFRGVVIGLD